MTEDEKKEAGCAIRNWRIDHNFTRERLAEMIGVSSKTLQAVELGYRSLGGAAQKMLEQAQRGLTVQKTPVLQDRNLEPTGSEIEKVIELVLDKSIHDQIEKVKEALGCTTRRAAEVVVMERLRQTREQTKSVR